MFGRKLSGLPETAEATADWPLLLAGAGNPIGPLEAVAGDGGGFGLEPEVHRFLQPAIAAQLHVLQAL